jgi:hypothetical protein
MNSLLKDIPVTLFDAVAASTGNSTAYALPANATQVEYQTSFGSAPASITIQIQTSLDNINWSTVSSSTSTSGETKVFNSSGIYVRARINAVSGGSGITVLLVAKEVAFTIILPSGTTTGSLAIFEDTTGKILNELPFSGVATEVLLGNGSFGTVPNLFDQNLNTTNNVIFNSARAAFKSSDGSSGVSTSIVIPAVATITVKNGIITAVV